MTLSTLGHQPCASRPAWSSALAPVHLFALAPWDAGLSSVERTEAKLEAVFPHPRPNAT